jgi:hypothetical protein
MIDGRHHSDGVSSGSARAVVVTRGGLCQVATMARWCSLLHPIGFSAVIGANDVRSLTRNSQGMTASAGFES